MSLTLRQTKKRRSIIALAALIGVAIVLVSSSVFWELHLAGTVFQGFSDALIEKQYEKAYGLTSPELRAVTDYRSFVAAQDVLNSRYGNLEHVEVSNREVREESSGWIGTIDASLVFARESVPFIFVLKKQDGSWKVYSYHQQ